MEIEETTTRRSLNVKDWSCEDVGSWMTEINFSEEGKLLKAQGINGKALMELDKDALKEAGVSLLGRRLQLLGELKELFGTRKTESVPVGGSEPTSSVWKSRISLKDKKCWTPTQRSLYNSKTAVIIKECAKIWPGNKKVHFKHNEKNSLLKSELVAKLSKTCVISELGFGTECIANHIQDWAHEKNRRISDGYNYEIERKPAKRAKKHFAPSTNETDSGSELADLEESQEGQLSPKTALAIVLSVFNVNSIRMLTVREHLWPLGKFLKVKYRGKSKMELITPIANGLIDNSVVEVPDVTDTESSPITRNDVKFLLPRDEFLAKLTSQTRQKREESDMESTTDTNDSNSSTLLLDSGDEETG